MFVHVPAMSGNVPSRSSAEAARQRPRRRSETFICGSSPDMAGWVGKRVSGYNDRALVEADIIRYKRVIGDALRSHTNARRETEIAIAVQALSAGSPPSRGSLEQC